MVRYINGILGKIGPGIMALGFTIGTGSVTSMIVAGNEHGMDLLWVLFLSCLFSWILMNAYGRYHLVTGETALYAIKNRIKYGRAICLIIIIGITIGQWNSLIGILGITANAVFEALSRLMPSLNSHAYLSVLIIAIVLIATMYYVLLKGSFSIVEKVFVIFVAIMALSFILSLIIVVPSPSQIASGFVPTIPDVPGGKMLVAAFVGTTMAAATFLSRPLFLQGKGWDINNIKDQDKDALIAAMLIFFVSGTIMAISAAALSDRSVSINSVMDMAQVLDPILGSFAVAVFLVGVMGAGLSSVFPILMITPILISDYKEGVLDIKSNQFRIITGIACIIGLAVPVFGYNPINAQILSQVFNVFVLPLVIFGIFILINKESLMGAHKASLMMNIGIVLAFIFASIMSYTGIIAIWDSLG